MIARNIAPAKRWDENVPEVHWQPSEVSAHIATDGFWHLSAAVSPLFPSL